MNLLKKTHVKQKKIKYSTKEPEEKNRTRPALNIDSLIIKYRL